MSQPIFRKYDRAALDAQYTASSRVKNVPFFFEGWVKGSEAAREKLKAKLDVRYGDHPEETIDVFPAAQKAAPIHIFFHGGYWQSLNKRDFDFPALALVPAGITYVAVNYALCPTVTMTELVRQCRAAVAYCYRYAADWGADPNRLTVSGHSAGGHLTATMLITDWPGFSAGLPADMVKAGVAISGLYDLEPIRLSYVNDKLHLDQTESLALSPVRHVTKARGELVLAVGGAESDEYHRQQSDFAAAWKKAGGGPAIVDLPGHHHFSVLGAMKTPDGALARAIRRLAGV